MDSLRAPAGGGKARSGSGTAVEGMIVTTRASLTAAFVAACLTGTACGPLRLDATPEVRGTIVAVSAESVQVRHKSGGIFQVALTRDTQIIQNSRIVDRTLCPGLRTTVRLVGRAQFTASSVTVWSGRCR